MRFVTLYSPYKTWTLFQVTLLLDANVHEWGERSRLTPKWIKNLIHQLVRVTWKAWALTFTHLKCRKIWPKNQQRFPSTHTLKHAVSFMKPVRKRQESMNVSHICFFFYHILAVFSSPYLKPNASTFHLWMTWYMQIHVRYLFWCWMSYSLFIES